jgi:hypothetical protein
MDLEGNLDSQAFNLMSPYIVSQLMVKIYYSFLFIKL